MYHSPVRLVLASASPRRAELLSAAGFTFTIVPAEVDERVRDGEAVQAYVERLAIEKAAAVAAADPSKIVVAADTAVVVGGRILGKPRDDEDAASMLEALSGRDHEVWTGVAVKAGGRMISRAVSTTVRFSRLTDEEIAWYVGSREPRDKAGAYAVQGLGSRFVEAVEGSYSNVVGLPVATLYQMFLELGLLNLLPAAP